MTPSTRKSKTKVATPEEYQAFIQNIELMKVYLVESTLKRSRTPNPDGKLSYSQQVGKSKYVNTEGGFIATYPFQVSLLEENEEKPFGVTKVAFNAEYSSSIEMSDKIFGVFSQYNLPLNLHPYVREYIHTSTSRMGFPNLILPTLKTT